MNNSSQQKNFTLLINDFIRGFIADKQMLVLESDYASTHASSPMINNEIIELITNNLEQSLLIKLNIYDSSTGQKRERAMKMKYTDILIDLSKHGDQSLNLVWERQLSLLRKIPDSEWDKVSKTDWDGKITVSNKSVLRK